MPRPRLRFTIRGFMIAIAALAGLLALVRTYPEEARLVPLATPFVGLAALLAWRLIARKRRRLAAVAFWGASILVDFLCAAVCSEPPYSLIGRLLFLIWALALMPVVVGLGVAWGWMATRPGTKRRRSLGLVFSCVFLQTAFPVVASATLWPLYLAFHLSRPSLERLADQVAAGHPVVTTQWAGAYRIEASEVDAAGNVALIVDPHPGSPRGFVRVRSLDPPYYSGRPLASDLCVDLPGGWQYHVEE